MTHPAKLIKHLAGTVLFALSLPACAQQTDPMAFIDEQLAAHAGQTGAYGLERGGDALLLGEAVKTMRANFENFWTSGLSVPVEELYDGLGLMQKNVSVSSAEVRKIYRELHDYAESPENYSPLMRALIESTPAAFPAIARDLAWGKVDFLHDQPGKNDNRIRLDGGSQTTQVLARLAESARASSSSRPIWCCRTRPWNFSGS